MSERSSSKTQRCFGLKYVSLQLPENLKNDCQTLSRPSSAQQLVIHSSPNYLASVTSNRKTSNGSFFFKPAKRSLKNALTGLSSLKSLTIGSLGVKKEIKKPEKKMKLEEFMKTEQRVPLVLKKFFQNKSELKLKKKSRFGVEERGKNGTAGKYCKKKVVFRKEGSSRKIGSLLITGLKK